MLPPTPVPPPQSPARAASSNAFSPPRKFRVGVLGATGAVGQRFLQCLEGHPWFDVVGLGASERSIGKPYEAATAWQLSANLPEYVRGVKVVPCTPAAMPNVDFVFSALVRVMGGRGEG